MAQAVLRPRSTRRRGCKGVCGGGGGGGGGFTYYMLAMRFFFSFHDPIDGPTLRVGRVSEAGRASCFWLCWWC
jgi:hypothetical protein